MSRSHPHPLHLHGHSPLHRLAPQTKVAAMLGYVLAVVATPPRAVWAFAAHAALMAAVVTAAEIPPRFLLRRLSVGAPFVAFAVLLPFFGGGPRVEVAGLTLSVEGLWGAWNVLAKATLGLAASVVLVATTEIPHLLAGMERLRAPRLVVPIAGFMVRYLELVADELGRMRTAMIARGHRPRGMRHARALAMAGGALFIRSYERGERVHQAMLARGYQGAMPLLHRAAARPTEWMAAMTVPALAWLVAATALLA